MEVEVDVDAEIGLVACHLNAQHKTMEDGTWSRTNLTLDMEMGSWHL